MATKRQNPRLAKIHRSYTVEEIACLFGVHRNTVREWIKRGLAISDNKRPTLILGRDLASFLQAKRTKNKRPCKAGEIYCVGCRTAREPAGLMADYRPLTETQGNLIGICPVCERLMYRRVNLLKLAQVRGPLDVIFPQEQEHISERGTPSVNRDLNWEA